MDSHLRADACQFLVRHLGIDGGGEQFIRRGCRRASLALLQQVGVGCGVFGHPDEYELVLEMAGLINARGPLPDRLAGVGIPGHEGRGGVGRGSGAGV